MAAGPNSTYNTSSTAGEAKVRDFRNTCSLESITNVFSIVCGVEEPLGRSSVFREALQFVEALPGVNHKGVPVVLDKNRGVRVLDVLFQSVIKLYGHRL